MKFNYFWRQVETGDANKIEFIRGGEKLVPIAGWLFLVLSIFCAWWVFFHWIPMVRDEISNSLQMKEYRLAVFDYFLGGIPSVIIIEYFILGAWMIFGRVSMVVDKTLGTITKDYRVRSFSLYTRSCQTRDLTSISFRHVGNPKWILFFSAVHLHLKDATSRRLFLAPRKYQKEGRLMAQRIADFLGLPGPAE